MAERRISSGTKLLIGLLLFAVIIAAGRAVLWKMSESFQPTTNLSQ
jgi:hypothetical protein